MILDTDKKQLVLMCINQPEILGLTCRGNFLINKCLTSEGKRSTIDALDSALRSGYDYCAVTCYGTYATKRL